MKRKRAKLKGVALRYSTEGEWFVCNYELTINNHGDIVIVDPTTEDGLEGGAVRAVFTPTKAQLRQIIKALQIAEMFK